MAPRFTSVMDLWRSHVEPYQRLAWFLCEAAEREHRLNVQAWLDTPGAALAAWARLAHRCSTNCNELLRQSVFFSRDMAPRVGPSMNTT
jgi:hypothetical protein